MFFEGDKFKCRLYISYLFGEGEYFVNYGQIFVGNL